MIRPFGEGDVALRGIPRGGMLPSCAEARSIMPSPSRLPFVDALRGVACLWVVLMHAHGLFADAAIPSNHPITPVAMLAHIGYMGVSLFLTLSGFCLFYPLARKDVCEVEPGTFFKRRALRIVPPYYASALLTLPLVLALPHLFPGQRPAGWQDYLVHALMLHNLDRSAISTINPVYWSIALEWQLYLLFPLLLWSVRRFGFGRVLLAALALSLIWQFSMWPFCRSHQGAVAAIIGRSVPARLFEFVVGMATAHLVAHPRPGQARIAGAVFPVALVPALWLAYPIADGYPGREAAWALVWSATILLLARFSGVWRSAPWRALVWIGTFSYSIYLVHLPLLTMVRPWMMAQELSVSGVFLVIALIAVPVIVGVSYAFFCLVERRFISGGRPR